MFGPSSEGHSVSFKSNCKRIAPKKSLSGIIIRWIGWAVTENDCFKGTIFINMQCELKKSSFSNQALLFYYISLCSVPFLFLQFQKAHLI